MFASTDNPTMSQGVTTQDIISKLNRTILSNVSEVVDPFVDIINASKKRDSLITEVLRGLPEYKLLLAENTRLREITGNAGVKIHINEKMTSSESVNSIDSLREEYGIPESDNIVSDVKTVKTTLTNNDKVTVEPKKNDYLSGKIRSWALKLDEFANLVTVDNQLYDDFHNLKDEFDLIFGENALDNSETVITVVDSDWSSILGNKMNKTIAKLEAVAAVVPTEIEYSEEEEEREEEEADETSVDKVTEVFCGWNPKEHERVIQGDKDENEALDNQSNEDTSSQVEVLSEEEEDDGTVNSEEEEEEEERRKKKRKKKRKKRRRTRGGRR